MRISTFSFWVGLALLSYRSASAHDMWLTLEGAAEQRRAIVNYGHPDDRPPALADKVVDLVAIGPNETASLRAGLSMGERNGYIVAISVPFLDDGHQLFSARYDNGFWVKTSDGYRNATRRSEPNAQEAMWSSKSGKAISGIDSPWQRVVGHELEIVPLSDPAAVTLGSALELRVLFHGKPLAGTSVERGDGTSTVPEADIPRFKTDADGIAIVPIISNGPQLLVVDHRVAPSATPHQADYDLFNATFAFEVKR